MTREVTKYEIEMLDKVDEWLDCDINGNCTLRDDAPKEIKDFLAYWRKKESQIPSCFL